MKVLLDECVDWRLTRDLRDLDVKTVEQMGWREKKNGALLALASGEFDIFVTVDKNLAFQQNVDRLPLAVVVLHGTSARLHDLRPLVPVLLSILPEIKRGELRHIGLTDLPFTP